MAGKSGKRQSSKKKPQGATGSSSSSRGTTGGAAAQQQQQGSAPGVPRLPSRPQQQQQRQRRPQRSHSGMSEGSRGPSPMMVSSPTTKGGGYAAMGSAAAGGGMVPPHFQYHHNPMPQQGQHHSVPPQFHAVHPSQQQQFQHAQKPPALTGQPMMRGHGGIGGGAFQQPLPYYPFPPPGGVMNYPPPPPPPPPPIVGMGSGGTVNRSSSTGSTTGDPARLGNQKQHITTTQQGTATSAATATITAQNNEAAAASAAMSDAADGMKRLVQQDIERGLAIDFYSDVNMMGDPMLLASWASFFRDQFIETRDQLAQAKNDRTAEAYRRATGFVERVELKILETQAMKQIFRRSPITPVDDPTFVDTCYRAIIDFHMRNPPFDGFTFGNPTWRDYMWFKAGLMRVVDEGKSRFLDWYAQRIRESLDEFIYSSETGAEQDLMEAAKSGMQSHQAYTRAKQVYVNIIEDILPLMEDSAAHASSIPKVAPMMIVGAKVRKFFSVDEEAFILAVIQTHLQDKEKSKVGSSAQDALPPRGSPVPVALSKVMSVTVELIPRLEAQESSHGTEDPLLAFQSTITGGDTTEDDVMMETSLHDRSAEMGDSSRNDQPSSAA